MEHEFIEDLVNQGYENPKNIKKHQAMLANVRVQIQSLNAVSFSDNEWARYVEEYLDKPSDNLVEKTRKIHDNHICDFVFDGRSYSEHLLWWIKRRITRNKLR